MTYRKLAIIIGVVAVIGAAMFSTPVPTRLQDATTAADSAYVLDRERIELIAAAKHAVTQRVKDPASAQFGEFTVRDNVVCGSVNSKNSFGGYTGPQRFYVFGTLVYFEGDFKDLTAEEAKLPSELRATCGG